MLDILHSKKALSFPELFESTATELKCLWNDTKPPHAIRAWLGLDPDSLIFGVEIPLPLTFDASLKPGTFQEGLWKQDVAELFLCENQSSRYQEFNVSPAGAWWTQVFSDYRKPQQTNADVVLPEIYTEMGKATWKGGLKVKVSSMGIKLLITPETRVNVCAITQQPKPHYFSLANLSSPKPDFHLVQQFERFGEHGRK